MTASFEKNKLLQRIDVKRRENDARRSFLLNLKDHLDKTEYTQYSLFKKKLSLNQKTHIIANIQKANKTGDSIRDDFNLGSILEAFYQTELLAICVVTETSFFQGKMNYLKMAIELSRVPILMKDIVIDELQLYEARYCGASAVWLIAEILSDEELKHFLFIAKQLDMDAVVEIRNIQEYTRVLSLGVDIIVLEKSLIELMESIKKQNQKSLMIVYGDIQSPKEVLFLEEKGACAVIIEELFLRSRDIISKIKEFI